MSSDLCPDYCSQFYLAGEIAHVGYSKEKLEQFSHIKISLRGLSVVRKLKKKLFVSTKKCVRAAFWYETHTTTGQERCYAQSCPCKEQNLVCVSFPLPKNLPSSFVSSVDGIEVCYQVEFEGICVNSSKKNVQGGAETFEFKMPIVILSCMRLNSVDWGVARRRHSQGAAMGRSVMDTVKDNKASPQDPLPYSTEGITVEMVSSSERGSSVFGQDIKFKIFIDNDSEGTITQLNLALIQELTYYDNDIEFLVKQQDEWKRQVKQWKKSGVLPAQPEFEMDYQNQDTNSSHKYMTIIEQTTITDRFPLEPGKTFSDQIVFPVKDFSNSFAPTIRGVRLFKIDYFLQASFNFREEKIISPLSRMLLHIFSVGDVQQAPSEQERKDLLLKSGHLDSVIAGRDKDMELFSRELLFPDKRSKQYYMNPTMSSATSTTTVVSQPREAGMNRSSSLTRLTPP